MAVAIDTQTERYGHNQQRHYHFRPRNGEYLLPTHAPPDDDTHRQQHQILGQRFPIRQFHRVAKATAILHRQPHCRDERNGRKKQHCQHCKYRNEWRTYTEQQHQTHHQFRTAQPDRKAEACILQALETKHIQILTDLDSRAPRIDNLDKSRKDKRQRKQYAAQGRYRLEHIFILPL